MIIMIRFLILLALKSIQNFYMEKLINNCYNYTISLGKFRFDQG